MAAEYVHFPCEDASNNETEKVESQPSWMWTAPKVNHFQGRA